MAAIIPPKVRKFISIPDGSMDTWLAAKAGSASARARIAVLGDSIGSGIFATDFAANGFVGRIKAALVAAGQTWGSDYWPVMHSQQFIQASGYTWQGTPPWVINATNVVWGGGSFNKHLLHSVAYASFDRCSFTLPYTANGGIDIWHHDVTAGTWNYKNGAGAPVTVTNTGSGLTKKISIAGPITAGTVFTFDSGSGAFAQALAGITTHADAANGIQLARLTYNGALLTEITTAGGQPDNILVNYSSTTHGFPMQPHLLIIALGANDSTYLIGMDRFRLTLERIIEATRKGVDNASVMLVAECVPDGVYSDVTTTLNEAKNWPMYVSVMQQVAAAKNCAFANIHAKWGQKGLANGFHTASNDLHPTNAGHQDIANLLMRAI